jgi:hypothetical protein
MDHDVLSRFRVNEYVSLNRGRGNTSRASRKEQSAPTDKLPLGILLVTNFQLGRRRERHAPGRVAWPEKLCE